MKKTTFILLVFISLGCSASNEEKIAFGLKVLNETFNAFEERHSICIKQSKQNKLSAESIEILKKLPISTGDGLGYLNLKAIRNCSKPEYNEVIRLLLTLESANKKLMNSAVSEKIEMLKSLMFPASELTSEKKFYELPSNVKQKLLLMNELNQPFDMVDGFEKAWLN
ncbi:hypothetical protein [Psychromonas antarctica]|uniref:hypothetical protein n=1 Tax=Psychromonas antarctica TaxID=67573 RepID=UPI001EE944FE|nr:hypothetical protein [Psychromonas antarctica]MCG6202953.1 hypothetical protein [Psychromonas antarctica]